MHYLPEPVYNDQGISTNSSGQHTVLYVIFVNIIVNNRRYAIKQMHFVFVISMRFTVFQGNETAEGESLPNQYSALLPISVHASQAFSMAHCTDSEDLP